ncbi:hypothetical protein INS49_015222 [Diaporthe citri]|uniref:uncharacterized protein n=1 Tax=Diaporthe citri TaxID=83186 RepID=UPI001C814161|nr:uncharacterized protein INS49_015222 [Diaporthe citri]KAG6355842.1 hypothetical protein INS49_015222 [Diaporthe citri]
MEADPIHTASPVGEANPRNLPKQRSRAVSITNPRDNVTILLLLVIAIFIPPLAVLCITSCDGQFVLNLGLELLTFGIASFFHAVWVILYYGKGGHLTWGQRRKLERQRPARALEFPADPQPPQVRNEAYADAPAYSDYGGGHGGDSKFA